MAAGPGYTNPLDQLATAFKNNGLIVWWQQASGQTYGQNGEQGIDYDMPYQSKVGSATSGTVVYAGKPPESSYAGQSSIGYIVQVLNADGSVVHYQHLDSINPNIHTGGQIQAGDWVGLSGGCPLSPNGSWYSGNSCPGGLRDQDSSGPHIEVRYTPKYQPNLGVWQGQGTAQNGWIDPAGPNGLFSQLHLKFATATPANKQVNQAGSQTCAPWDIACMWGQVSPTLVSWGEHIAIFLIALLLIIVGFFLLAGKSIVQAGRDAASGAKAVIA